MVTEKMSPPFVTEKGSRVLPVNISENKLPV